MTTKPELGFAILAFFAFLLVPLCGGQQEETVDQQILAAKWVADSTEEVSTAYRFMIRVLDDSEK